ncbi:hypothetical protein CERSUDRAFT_95664 [Gelatoporia subvermispora B]|uniref:DUF6534 domain-containing protein n=1 Tax=Ceriporiopsis subvermispora (strain B) TaxID=914234 RepID=M2RC09_CERS8|nr:hypothetical protein CERSUDRAFT_95664 [Gelatoporia subvermispora B]
MNSCNYGVAAPVEVDGFSIGDTLGACLVGVILSAVLYGLTVGQCYNYFGHSTFDPRPVGILGLLDTMHIVFVTHAIYHYTITLFGNPSSPVEPPVWSVSVLVPIEVLLETTVRGLFCHRIWKLSGGHRERYCAIPLVALSLVTFAAGLDFMAKVATLLQFEDVIVISWRLYIGTGAGVAADLVIALLQVVLLLRCRTGFTKTDTVLRSLMIYSINTGALTSMCASACMLMFAVKKNSYIYVALYLILPQLLLVSLLATYNARRYLRETALSEKLPVELLEMPYAFRDTTKVTRIGPDSGFGRLVEKELNIRVKMTTETKLDTEEELTTFDSRS